MNMGCGLVSQTCNNRQFGLRWGKYAVYCVSLFALCLCETVSIHRYLQMAGYTLTQIEYVYLLLACGSNMPYSSILYLLLLGDMSQMQHKVFLGRQRHHMLHSIVYCFGFAIVTAILIAVNAYILSIPFSSIGDSWMEASLMSAEQLTSTLVHPYIIQTMEPMFATILAFSIVCLFWSASALFLYSMCQFKLPHLGIMLYIIGIQWSSIWFGEEIPAWFPVRCYTLNGILMTAEKGSEAYAILQGIQYLGLGLIVLVILSNLATKYAQHQEEKKQTSFQ